MTYIGEKKENILVDSRNSEVYKNQNNSFVLNESKRAKGGRKEVAFTSNEKKEREVQRRVKVTVTLKTGLQIRIAVEGEEDNEEEVGVEAF